jgi:hypothetical protein
VSGGGPRDRLEAAKTTIATDGPRVIGVGWATVDLDRAAAELAADLDLETEDFVHAPDSVALGARSRVAAGSLGVGVALVVLEPATEGRLAGHLARQDEGPAVIWLGGRPAATTPGPFGPEALDGAVPGHPNLLRIIVDQPPGTIRS